MVLSINDIKKKFFSKVGSDKFMSDLFTIYNSSKVVGDDSKGQRFVITDKSLNDLAVNVNENVFLDIDENNGFVTYRFTIALLKKLGMDLALEMSDFLVGKK